MVSKITVNLVTNQQLASFYNSVAVAWFAAGVIAPLFTSKIFSSDTIYRAILGIITTFISLNIATTYGLKATKKKL